MATYGWVRMRKTLIISAEELLDAVHDQASTKEGLEYTCLEHEGAIEALYFTAMTARLLAQGVPEKNVKEAVLAIMHYADGAEQAVAKKHATMPYLDELELN